MSRSLRPRVRARAEAGVGLAILLLVGWGVPEPASAQSGTARLWAECSEGLPTLAALCADGALAVQALHGGIGLQMTAGGALPASPSTAGHRTESVPRIVVDVGGTWATFRHPGLSRYGNQSSVGDERSFITGARLTTVVGVFDGFSPAPGMGGVLAVDAVAAAQIVRVPDSQASGGSRVGWGGGVRVGIFRESFSLPGLTVSGIHQRAGELKFGTREGTGALAAIKPSLTSLRVIVGKDLWPIGLSFGMGRDRYSGEGRVEARRTEGTAIVEASSGPRELSLSRNYFFGGVNFTWVVTQIAAEVSWAGESSPLIQLEGTGPFRPGGRALQGALTFRLIY